MNQQLYVCIHLFCVCRIESLSPSNGIYAWQPRIINARYFKRIDWAQESVLLLIISTAGDGEIICPHFFSYSHVFVAGYSSVIIYTGWH